MATYCKCCHEEIKNCYDLVVVANFFKLTPYHINCYTLLMKDSNFFFLGKPVNSFRGSFTPFFLLFSYLFCLLIPSFRAETPIHFVWAFISLSKAL